jgi:hypothetical protein
MTQTCPSQSSYRIQPKYDLPCFEWKWRLASARNKMTRELVMRNFVCKFVSEIMTRELVMAIADRGTSGTTKTPNKSLLIWLLAVPLVLNKQFLILRDPLRRLVGPVVSPHLSKPAGRVIESQYWEIQNRENDLNTGNESWFDHAVNSWFFIWHWIPIQSDELNGAFRALIYDH